MGWLNSLSQSYSLRQASRDNSLFLRDNNVETITKDSRFKKRQANYLRFSRISETNVKTRIVCHEYETRQISLNSFFKFAVLNSFHSVRVRISIDEHSRTRFRLLFIFRPTRTATSDKIGISSNGIGRVVVCFPAQRLSLCIIAVLREFLQLRLPPTERRRGRIFETVRISMKNDPYF